MRPPGQLKTTMNRIKNIAELTAYGLIMLALCSMATGNKTVQAPTQEPADVLIIENI